MEIKTRIINEDSNLRLARNIEISVKSKTFLTPRRTLSAKKSRRYDETSLRDDNLGGFVEIYNCVNRKDLQKAREIKSYELKKNYEFSSLLKKAGEDITICVIEYDLRKGLPDKGEIELLFDLFNSRLLDILVCPIVPKLPYKEYVKFLDEFIEAYRSTSFNAVLVPAIIPYSRIDLAKLFEYYAKKDEVSKNFICVDFNGGNPISQYTFVSDIIRNTQKFEQEFGEPCVRYAINLKYGKATKKEQIVPAKDIVIFSMGFNLFGSNHRQVVLEDVGGYELRTKILNRADYGYYSLEVAENAIKESGNFKVKLSDLKADPQLSKLFNAERQGLEAIEISTMINEDRLYSYLQSKPRIVENKMIFKRISKVNKDLSQQTLPNSY